MRPAATTAIAVTAVVALCGVVLVALARDGATEEALHVVHQGRPGAVPLAGSSRPARRSVVAAERGSGWYDAPRGTVLAFRASAEMRTRWLTPEGPQPPLDVDLAARLVIVVVDREGRELITRWQLDDLTLRSPSGPLTELEHDLALPFHVRMTDDGRTVGYRFSRAMRADNADWLRTITGAMRCVMPDGDPPAWSTLERDGTGPARFEYSWRARATTGGGRIARRRLRYELDSESVPAGSANALVTFDRALGWVRRVSWRDDLRMPVAPLKSTLEYAFTFHADLETVRRLPSSELERIDGDAEWAPPSAAFGVVAETDADARELRAAWENRLRGTTIGELLAQLKGRVTAETIASQEVAELKSKLAWLLRLRPQQLRAVRALLDAELGNEPLASVLLGALGEAGTPGAQSALVEYASDGSLRETVRASALWSMSQLERPGRSAHDLAWRLARGGASSELLANSGLLLAGTLAGRPGGERQLDRLKGLEAEAKREGKLAAWLSAVANSRAPAVRDLLGGYAGHRDSQLRMRAVRGLAEQRGEGVAAVLAKRAREEGDPRIRAEAVLGLGRQSVGPSAFDEPLRDPDLRVRRNALGALVPRLGKPSTRSAARALLERVVRTDPDPELRGRARRLLRR